MIMKQLRKLWNYEISINNNKSLRQKAIQGLILFFIILILFTIVSRVATTFTMPRVVVASTERREISHTLELQGSIEAGAKRGVFTHSGLRIEAVHVMQGSRVQEGDPLLSVCMTFLRDQIKELELQEAIRELNMSDASHNQGLSQQQHSRNQQRAQEDLGILQAHLDREVQEARDRVNQAQQELDQFLQGVGFLSPEGHLEDVTCFELLSGNCIFLTGGIHDLLLNASNNGLQEFPSSDTGLLGDPSRDLTDQIYNTAEIEATLRANLSVAQTQYQQAIRNREDQLRQANRAVNDANQALPQNSSVEISEMELDHLRHTIEDYKELYYNEGLITSNISGTIVSVEHGITVGNFTPNTSMMLIADTSDGFIFRTTMNRDDQNLISTGDFVRLNLQRGGTLTDLIVESIIPSTQASHVGLGDTAEERMEVIVRVPAHADIQIHDQASLMVEGERNIYNLTIPISALRSGAVGEPDFVFVLRESNTILGSQMIVERVAVQVQDNDGVIVAIGDFDLTSEQRVVVSSDRMLSAGDRVMLQE